MCHDSNSAVWMTIKLAFGILESSQIRFLIACTETPKHGLHDWHLFRHGRRPLLQTKHNDPPCRPAHRILLRPAAGWRRNCPDEIQLEEAASARKKRDRGREEEEEGAGRKEEEAGVGDSRGSSIQRSRGWGWGSLSRSRASTSLYCTGVGAAA